MPPTPEISYEIARAQRGPVIQAAHSSAQADIYEYDWEGRLAVLKDFNARPALIKKIYSGKICAREIRALRRLETLDGVPHLLATAGPYAFIMERVEGKRLPGRKELAPPPEYWPRARKLLEALHEAGVSHGDLRRKNMLIGPNAEAHLIDFATAARDRTGGIEAWFSRLMFRHIRKIDRVTFARIKESYWPEGLDETEKRWLASEPSYLRIGRWLKKYVYRLRKPGVVKTRLVQLSRRLTGYPVKRNRRRKIAPPKRKPKAKS